MSIPCNIVCCCLIFCAYSINCFNSDGGEWPWYSTRSSRISLACDQKVGVQRFGENTTSLSAVSVTRSNNSRLRSKNSAYSKSYMISSLFV